MKIMRWLVWCLVAISVDGEVRFRLVDGPVPNVGRVEVQYEGIWGTICDDSFGEKEAIVACRYFGYSGGVAKRSAYYGEGTGQIWMDNLQCNGTEMSLEFCPFREWGRHNCDHGEDAGIQCNAGMPNSTPYPVQYRLVDGPSRLAGRVEVYYNNIWGTICDDSFGQPEVNVICGYFGHSGGVVKLNAYYGMGSGPVWMDELECNGTEGSLEYCKFAGWGTHNCRHTEDVGVDCMGNRTDTILPPKFILTHLPHMSLNHGGLLEVFYNDTWGSICDNKFYEDEAEVACRSFGYTGGKVVRGLASYDDDYYHYYDSYYYDWTWPGMFWTGVVACNGTEAALDNCSFSGWGPDNCDFTDSVGVECYIDDTVTPPVQYRLVGGPSPNAGRVEVFYRGTWGTICDDDFGPDEALVVCRSFNYTGGMAVSSSTYGEGRGTIWMDGMQCTGRERSLEHCPFNGWGQHDCFHFEDVGVHCFDNQTNNASGAAEFRLVDGSRPNNGRVEVFFNGMWGTICDDNFDQYAATVACKYFGFSGGVPRNEAAFGRGTGTIWMDQLQCTGSESSLEHCSFGGWGSHDCTHWEDAGVECNNMTTNITSTQAVFRLVDGPNAYSGRVEVYYQGEWGTICDDDFGSIEASVVCKSLGLRGGTAHGSAYYGGGSGTIWMDDVQCTGEECSLAQCRFYGWGHEDCSHSEDVAVKCSPANVQYRLNNGTSPDNGRLEVAYDGVWGTVCANGFDDKEAAVICRALGFSGGYAMPVDSYGQGSGPIWMSELQCMGTESSLEHCPFNSCGDLACTHMQDAAVNCSVVDCGKPRVPTGYALGRIGSTTFYNNITVSCAVGFTGSPNNITCNKNGMWSTPTGCFVVDCGQPLPKTGYVLGSVRTTLYGSSVSVSCSTGYSGVPKALTCQANGDWSSPFGCTIIVCGEPVVPLGYKLYSIASRTYGSIVPVICGSRYTGKPKAIRCNADGVWSTPTGCSVPVCPNGTYGEKCGKTCQCATDNTVSCDVMTGSCTCKDGWAGAMCSIDIDECSNPDIHRCPVGTKCQNKQGSFDCLCKSGDSSSLVAAAATMGGLNIILLAALVFLFLRHKNILPAIKSDWEVKFTKHETEA